MSKPNAGTLREVAAVFFRLGLLAFGGPAAHIAMMEDEVVRKRQWMTPEHFLDLIGATNLIPGPNSTEMTMHCGHERAGLPGLVVAGLAFILPAVVITAGFAWLYQQYGHLPQAAPFVYGIPPAVIAIILGAAYTLGRKALKSSWLAVLGAATLVAALLGLNEIVALLGAGAVGVLGHLLRNPPAPGKAARLLPLLALPAGPLAESSSAGGIFWTFLKVGATLYGSGYVLFAFLEGELVARGWLSRQQLLDAIAVGQFTPGPVLSSATFVGWQLDGLRGAALATVGIFLPSFVFVLVLNPLLPRLRRSKLFSVFLDSVNVASVALIAAVLVTMSRAALTDWRTVLIASLSLAVTFVYKKLNSAFVVLGGALLGYLLTLA
ncbi:chromate efflux transporter [Hymenobacter sp. BT683]|uniref:Chromate efflux transporter n=1 Tax=Hymenobacter jeongseonensis TaxID=2791027 RepID=A0ABS0IE79_9BACT|nr:chromate efflux transporter [Hymenobacter jeongseonensis]MBF9236658.1 chromate efflux transporter [Hymenobacter jeongseonensis]